MKLVNLLNEARYKTVLKKLPPNRKKPKAIVALRIKRVERGGSEAEINVTTKELIDIFRSTDFPARYRTSNYVYQVEIKKSKNNKQVAIVNIFKTNNLPDDIDLNEPADFDLNGAKVYLMTPDAIRFKSNEIETGKSGTGETETSKIGDEKKIDGKLHVWDGNKWVLKTGTGTGPKIGDEKKIDGKLHVWDGNKWVLKTDIFTITGKAKTGTATSKYKVVSGDTLSKIAKKHGMTSDDIIQLNPQIQDLNKIFPGQSINVSGEPVISPKVDVEKEKEVDEAKPVILNQTYLYKQLESKFPEMFRGDRKVAQKVYKQLFVGDLPLYAETYEKSFKRALDNPVRNVDERGLLNMFKSLSRNQLATFFKRYKDINGTELYADLYDTTFNTSEINEFLKIIQSKSLNISSKSKSLVFKNKQDKLQFVR